VNKLIGMHSEGRVLVAAACIGNKYVWWSAGWLVGWRLSQQQHPPNESARRPAFISAGRKLNFDDAPAARCPICLYYWLTLALNVSCIPAIKVQQSAMGKYLI
jgi:hypothetical protein